MKVLLIHGLGRSPLSLFNLGWRLQQAGHATEQFGYAAFMESYDCMVERLQVRLRTLAEQGTYGVVAHSLGTATVIQAGEAVAIGDRYQLATPPLAKDASLGFQWLHLPLVRSALCREQVFFCQILMQLMGFELT
jgi:hypothetical protein